MCVIHGSVKVVFVGQVGGNGCDGGGGSGSSSDTSGNMDRGKDVLDAASHLFSEMLIQAKPELKEERSISIYSELASSGLWTRQKTLCTKGSNISWWVIRTITLLTKYTKMETKNERKTEQERKNDT